MSSTVPPGAAQPQPQPSPNDAPLSWEGDKMFNIYILDYCSKRGYKKTAGELLREADIPPESKPPINARQGLLFEWWSVFWVLFTAKANGSGTEDALLYTQHQANQAMQRQMQQQRMQPPGQGPLPGTPVGQPGGPQQQPVQRMMNGPMGQRLGAPFPMNGQIPNGVSPAPLQPGQIAAGPGSFPSMAGPGQQPNGIPGSGPPPQTPGSTPAQPPNFQSLLPNNNQRTIGHPGGHQQSPQPPQPLLQQRQNGPFHPSPTMAHSPQAGAAGSAPPPPQQTTPQQQPQQPQQHHAQPPPMSQLSGPSPHMQHMNRGMPPPMNPLNPGVQQPGNTSNLSSFPPPSSQPRPPSRANTPGGQSSMLHPSPSLLARQPPGGPALLQANQEVLELRMVPPQMLTILRQELNLGDRDPNQMTPAERQRLLAAYRQRRAQKPDGSGPTAGLQQQNPAQMRGIPQQQPQQQPQRLKRSSATPEEQHEVGRTDSSPPQKRQRPSPEQVPMGMGYPQQPPQSQGPPGGPQPGQPGMPISGQNPLMMMRGPPQMGGVPQGGQPHMGTPMNMGLGQPPLSGPQMGVSLYPQGHANQPGLMNQQQLQWQYRMNLQLKGGPMPPQGMNPTIQGSATPSSTDPNMHPGATGTPGGPQFNRLPPQNKSMTMMPPPSPANGANKDQGGNKDVKSEDGSRNAGGNAGQTPNASGTPTPGPGGPTNQGPTPTTNGAPNSSIAASPSSILGPQMNPGLVNQQSVISDTLFPPDFMQHISNSLDDFNTSIFPPESDINFERDFGQWFNGDDVPLDMK